MGNILVSNLCCHIKRDDLGREFKESTLSFESLPRDTKECGRPSLSFGVVPTTIFSADHALPHGELHGFRPGCQNEREKDIEQENFVSEGSEYTNFASCNSTECFSYPETVERTTCIEYSKTQEESMKVDHMVAHEYTKSNSMTTSGSGKSRYEEDSKIRKRGIAIDVKPIDPPGGNILTGKQFYLQNPELEWEAVTIEKWNSWNGTWQVRGLDGTAFPASPKALKSEEEYRFFSRERNFSSRSFKSFS